MNTTLLFGLILFSGFVGGELVKLIGLPKVTGFILAGVLLNPDLLGIVPHEFTNNTNVLTNVALSFITFSVGGSLFFKKIKKQGKGIIYITLLEAELAFIFTAAGLFGFLYFLGPLTGTSILGLILPVAILLGSLASPTDPSATLAVKTEYKAKGVVMSTIMGVAAFDDVLGIINYSIATVVALALVGQQPILLMTLVEPLLSIIISISIGVAFGFLMNFITSIVKREEDSVLLVILSGILLLTFGISSLVKVDQLLATMAVGVIVVNFNPRQNVIFKMLERYTDEIIFTLFFTISGLRLNFVSLSSSYWLILVFIIFRFIGKAVGVVAGGALARAPAKIRLFVTGGLLPQGGIVVGLALMISQYPAFSQFSDFILNIVLGATVIHELLGPMAAKTSLKKAGEIKA